MHNGGIADSVDLKQHKMEMEQDISSIEFNQTVKNKYTTHTNLQMPESS